jgi:plasmid stabilization system protein ParE
MSGTVEFTDLANEDVDSADEWWFVHRPAARDAVRDEITRAIALLAEQPHAGVAVRGTRYEETRKLVLRRINYQLYYRVTATGIEVLRLWHGSRRTRPRL